GGAKSFHCLEQLLLACRLDKAVEPPLQDFHAGDDRDCQLLALPHGLDLLAEFFVPAIGEQRHDVRIQDDHPPASRRARASASRSSRSWSSWKTPKCLSTACLEPGSGARFVPCWSLWSRRSSSRSRSSSANGDSRTQCG